MVWSLICANLDCLASRKKGISARDDTTHYTIELFPVYDHNDVARP